MIKVAAQVLHVPKGGGNWFVCVGSLLFVSQNILPLASTLVITGAFPEFVHTPYTAPKTHKTVAYGSKLKMSQHMRDWNHLVDLLGEHS